MNMLLDSPAKVVSEPFYPFESKAFHQCWWDHLSGKFAVKQRYADFLIHRVPYLKGFVGMREFRIAGWNAAWSQDFTASRLRAFKAVTANFRWDYFRMAWNEERAAHQCFEQLEAMGFKAITIPLPDEYVVDLSQGWDAYMKSRSQNTRKDIRRKFRRAESLHPKIVRFDGVDAVEPFFDKFFSYHIPYWTAKTGNSYFNDPKEREFTVAWAKSMAASGHLLLEGLQLGDEIANFSASIIDGDKQYWLFTINTDIYLEHSPGLLGLYLRLEQAAKAGITMFNMGTGDYRYKVQAANHQLKRFEVIVPNKKSLRGRAYVAWLQYRLKQFTRKETESQE